VTYVGSSHSSSSVLLQAVEPIVSSQCSSKPTDLCAGTGQQGTCPGDSGSPLVCKQGDRWFQYGINSRNYYAGDCSIVAPDVFANIVFFLPWIQRQIGRESLRLFVRPLTSNGRDRCPVCNVAVLWPNGWMDQDATWYGGRHRPGDIVLDGDPAPHGKGHSSPHFLDHFALARSPISATAELLLLLSCTHA